MGACAPWGVGGWDRIVQITSSDDSSIVLATLGKGAFFGETALFFWPARRSAGVRATVRLVALPHSLFLPSHLDPGSTSVSGFALRQQLIAPHSLQPRLGVWTHARPPCTLPGAGRVCSCYSTARGLPALYVHTHMGNRPPLGSFSGGLAGGRRSITDAKQTGFCPSRAPSTGLVGPLLASVSSSAAGRVRRIAFEGAATCRGGYEGSDSREGLGEGAAQTHCVLYVMHKKTLEGILAEFPDEKEAIVEVS